MRRIAMALATAGLVAGALVGTPTASAASTNNTNVTAPVPPPTTPVPVISALDCYGSTGWMGCGPGWFWRNGWRGPSCYPC